MTCPTLCDRDCDEICHEVHVVKWRRDHQPMDCPAIQAIDHAAQHDIPIADFPMTIELFRVDTREVVWRKVVLHPQGVWIPPIGPELGVLVGTRVTTGRGEVTEMLPEEVQG